MADTPDTLRQQIWRELGRAGHDRHHAWRTPVLATVGRDGAVNARTVVLRDADADRQRLRCFTDRRSPKVAELAVAPDALFVFWSARLHWQLRVRVHIQVQTEGAEIDALWQRVRQSAAATDYLGPAAPGSPWAQTAGQDETETREGVHHFALLQAQVCEMDWLELGRSGHRRARILPDGWEWLTP